MGIRFDRWLCSHAQRRAIGLRFAATSMLLLSLLPAFVSAAAGEPLNQHLGVASCAGNTCHGATRPFADARIRQDEYFIWQRQDPHARAYRSLQSSRSTSIAKALGIAAADQSQACLVCHADNVPKAQRGERFQVDDGIGCEACHGAAQEWMAGHVKGYTSNEAREAAGLVPGWRPEVRAKGCVACHVGDEAHPISHAMMAAGHPPLLFELDTFTTIEPPHWDVDADYIARKSEQDPARNWASGQAAASRAMLENLASTAYLRGSFPELAFFDCNACHHSMHAERARPDRSGGMPLGAPPLADAPMVLLNRWLDVADPAIANTWRDNWRALHASTQAGPLAVQARARVMIALLDRQIIPRTSTAKLNPTQLRTLMSSVVGDARNAHVGDFSHAEQTAMAVSVLTTAMSDRGAVQVGATLRLAVDDLYERVRDRDRFRSDDYTAALARVSGALLP